MIGTTSLNLDHTPGFYYALAYWLSTVFYIRMNTPRLSRAERIMVEIALFILLEAFMILTDGIDVRFYFPCIFIDIAMIFGCLLACCDIEPIKAGYFTVRAFLLGELAASLEWQLFYFGITSLHFPLNWASNLFFLLSTHILVFMIMYLLEKRYQESNQALPITGKELKTAMLLAVFMYLVSNVSFVLSNTPFSSTLPFDILIIRTLVDLGGVGMLYAYHVQLNEMSAKTQNQYLQNMLHMQYEHYRMTEEGIDLVNQKYHDLKHQISLLKRGLDSEKSLQYLDSLEQEIKSYEAQNKTGNKILDTILTMKSLQCQKENIHLTCVADGKEISFLDPMDISALFGNALDNAMESVSKIPDQEKRLIHVSVARQKNFLRIRVENCYEGKLHFHDGIPATTKSDRRYHGYGLRSIRQIAEKYSGSVTINTEDGWFDLRILIPIPCNSQ
ncbi:MAG: sensor histidine kinase [Lachnospiraceae bacterium]|nr:sensor histidine kinase [Lachnospiraceae bacterium]